MRSYEAARGSFSLFEVLARIIVALGILAAVGGGYLAVESMGRNVPPPLAFGLGAIPGAFIALAGFYGLAMAQMGRATVDSAEYAQQSLAVSREQLELSRQALEQGKSAAASYADNAQQQPSDHNGAAAVAATGASYSNQSAQNNPAPLLGDAETHAASAEPASDNTAQLEHTPTITADELLSKGVEPSPLQEVKKVGSSYLVGNKAFKSKGEAMDYQINTSKS